MSWNLSALADCLLRVEKYDEADSTLHEAEQLFVETDERSHVGEVFRLRGLLLTKRGDFEQGAVRLWDAVEWARSRSAKLFELRALRDLASMDLPQSQAEMAATALRNVLAWFPVSSGAPDIREARSILS
jgi:hypothetical protein